MNKSDIADWILIPWIVIGAILLLIGRLSSPRKLGLFVVLCVLYMVLSFVGLVCFLSIITS